MMIIDLTHISHLVPFLIGIQIGPKIRIGGTLGHLGQQIKEKVLPSPASIVGGAVIPLGSLIGSAINGSVASDAGKGLVNASLVGGIKAAAGAIGGDGGSTGTTGTGGGSGDPGTYGTDGDGGGFPTDGSSTAGSVGSSVLGGLEAAAKVGGSTLLSYLQSHAADIAKLGLDAANIYNQYQRGQKSDQYAQKYLDQATKDYAAKQPLRDAGMAGMLNPSAKAPDLSALKAQGQNGLQMMAPTPPPQADLSGLRAQGQNGLQMQATLPMANPAQAGGMANLRGLAGQNSGNPFAKALPMASGGAPSAPPLTLPMMSSPQAPPMGGPPTAHPPINQPVSPTLPVAAPPRQNEPSLPTGGPTGGLTMPSAPPLPPMSYGNGAPTTATTWAQPNAQGKFSAAHLTPNDAGVGMPYNPYAILPLARGY